MSFLQDIRYGVRMIVKAPGFTALAMLALAIGVCANTTIFTFVNGLLLRPLTGIKDPGSVVAIYTSDFSSGLYGATSYPDFIDYRTQADKFEGLAAYYSYHSVNTTGDEESVRLRASIVTGNYFDLLGVKAELGRTFQPADEQPANAEIVVISDALWRRRYNASPAVIGQTLSLSNKPYTIVGVVDRSFKGLRLSAVPDLWLPMSTASDFAVNGRGSNALAIVGRLKSGVRVEDAQAQITTIAARLAEAYPETNRGTLERPNEPRPVTVVQESRVGPAGQSFIRRISFLLFAVVGLVLLIACANVANLLLARASVRRKEIAVRLAVGASRGRLVRQLLTESLLLALLGGGAGLLITQWTTGLLPKFFSGLEANLIDVSMDWRVLVFTLAISILTGLLFGLTPALQASRVNLLPSLKAEAASDGTRRRRISLRDALVISQLALSLVLLISAALFVRSLQLALNYDPGFAVQNLLVAAVEAPENVDEHQGRALFQQIIERVDSLPGVEAASGSVMIPLSGGGWRRFILPEGYQPQPGEDMEFNTNIIGLNFFNTMGIPIVAGRDFNAQDTQGSPLVVIVNEEMARRYYGGNAVGKRLQIGSHTPFIEIVGVARTVKYRDLREEPLPYVYIPFGQEYQPGMTVMVRTQGDPSLLAASVRNEIRALNKSTPAFTVETMRERIANQIAADRMIAVLLSIFGAGALLLATIGIYGVVSYSVAQRTHEIGVRIALGAEQRDILKMIVKQGMLLVFIGAGIGLLLAFTLTRTLQSLLFGVSATDPLTFTVVLLVLIGVALLACYLPARRATKVDPLVALRYE